MYNATYSTLTSVSNPDDHIAYVFLSLKSHIHLNTTSKYGKDGWREGGGVGL